MLVEQARHEHMSDEYKTRYIVVVFPHLGSTRQTLDRHIFGPERTDQLWEVKRTNTDLPNMYRRSTTETAMHPIDQNIF